MLELIEQTLLTKLLPYKQRKLFVAFSGGIDSVVLLHACYQLNQAGMLANDIVVCHIHHGLSEHADSWLDFAKQQAKHYGFVFKSKQVNLAKTQGNIEARARNARYQAFAELSGSEAESKALFLTGHHLDDQVETFLLALKRGSGTSGLSAMAELQVLKQREILRPLLSIKRTDIVAYAKKFQLKWFDDESNTDQRFDRNFLRQQILPLLTERWPHFPQAVAKSAEHCREAQTLIAEVAEQDLKACQVAQDQFDCQYLLSLTTQRFNHVIRQILANKGEEMPTVKQLAQLKAQLHADIDKTPTVKLASCYFRRFKNDLYITGELSELSSWSAQLDKTQLIAGHSVFIPLPDGMGQLEVFACQTPLLTEDNDANFQHVYLTHLEQLHIGFCHQNPVCLPDYRQKSRVLKKVLQELNLAPWQRTRQLFFYQENELLAAVGQFVCQPHHERFSHQYCVLLRIV